MISVAPPGQDGELSLSAELSRIDWPDNGLIILSDEFSRLSENQAEQKIGEFCKAAEGREKASKLSRFIICGAFLDSYVSSLIYLFSSCQRSQTNKQTNDLNGYYSGCTLCSMARIVSAVFGFGSRPHSQNLAQLTHGEGDLEQSGNTQLIRYIYSTSCTPNTGNPE